MTKKLLLIGSNSDIAKSAIELLAGSYDIVKISRQEIDLADPRADAYLEGALKEHDPDVVLNCAGVFGDNQMDFDQVFSVNVRSNWTLINHYLKTSPNKKVKIVMIGSSTYKQGRKNFILYAASKSALHNMWQGASEALETQGVVLGLINPVRVQTKMVEKIKHPNPQSCLQPRDVAEVIADLCYNMETSRSIDIDYKT